MGQPWSRILVTVAAVFLVVLVVFSPLWAGLMGSGVVSWWEVSQEFGRASQPGPDGGYESCGFWSCSMAPLLIFLSVAAMVFAAVGMVLGCAVQWWEGRRDGR